MSLYNLIFGCDPLTPLVLGTLGLSKDDLGRFVDAFPNSGQYVVLARVADDPNYSWVIDKMTSHPLYVAQERIEPGMVVFRFSKPSQGSSYVLPEVFVSRFENESTAWEAVGYLNRCQDRALQRSMVG